MDENSYINIYDLCESGTTELGPGLRYVIWVQGCPFYCKGCITPNGIPIVLNQLINTGQIVDSIILNKTITGITLSGGEPFLQASKLYLILSQVLSQRPELDVIVFTGYNLEQLIWPEAKLLLQYIDVLIDGRYIESKNNNLGLRGSSNQKIHFLTPRFSNQTEYFTNRNRSIEVRVNNNYLDIIGIPNQDIKL